MFILVLTYIGLERAIWVHSVSHNVAALTTLIPVKCISYYKTRLYMIYSENLSQYLHCFTACIFFWTSLGVQINLDNTTVFTSHVNDKSHSVSHKSQVYPSFRIFHPVSQHCWNYLDIKSVLLKKDFQEYFLRNYLANLTSSLIGNLCPSLILLRKKNFFNKGLTLSRKVFFFFFFQSIPC